MASLILSFFTSFLVTILIIRTQKWHGYLSVDHNLLGPQKFHIHAVPRIGGVGIVLGICLAIGLHSGLFNIASPDTRLLVCSIPVFLVGFLEDLTKKVSVRIRLLFIALGALLAYQLLDAQITHLGIPSLDFILTFTPIALILSVFAIMGLANAYNIIDGFNGLSSMVGMLTLLALGYIGIQVGDQLIIFLSFAMISAILGFFILNYPRGLIFLGDGGAYFIGFWIATLSIMIVARHHTISPWFALLINAYPICETLFSIYRRKFHQGKSIAHPDGIHFHSLIFRRILNHTKIKSESDWFTANAMTSPYLWVLAAITVVPAVLYWNSTPLLMGFFVLFAASYIWLYKKIVCFKTPRWMHIYSN